MYLNKEFEKLQISSNSFPHLISIFIHKKRASPECTNFSCNVAAMKFLHKTQISKTPKTPHILKPP